MQTFDFRCSLKCSEIFIRQESQEGLSLEMLEVIQQPELSPNNHSRDKLPIQVVEVWFAPVDFGSILLPFSSSWIPLLFLFKAAGMQPMEQLFPSCST